MMIGRKNIFKKMERRVACKKGLFAGDSSNPLSELRKLSKLLDFIDLFLKLL